MACSSVVCLHVCFHKGCKYGFVCCFSLSVSGDVLILFSPSVSLKCEFIREMILWVFVTGFLFLQHDQTASIKRATASVVI